MILQRALLLNRHRSIGQSVVDCGIGAGGFCRITNAAGFDISPTAREWLECNNLWHDLTREPADIVCFWDSLEHMLVPELMVGAARKMVLLSLPIFENGDAIPKSKHYKPDEHLWYFTERGLIGWFRLHGFGLVERNRDEERFGREGIGTYVFARA